MQAQIKLRESGNNSENIVRLQAMSTCGIASGAKEIMNFLMDELEQQSIEAVVTQTGCMGYCYAEPTIEVAFQGKTPSFLAMSTNSGLLKSLKSTLFTTSW